MEMKTLMNKDVTYKLTTEEWASLRESILSLLRKYDYDATVSGVDEIIEAWVEQKGWMIDLLKKSPNYVEGKFYIKLPKTQLERPIDMEVVRDFGYWAESKVTDIYIQKYEYKIGMFSLYEYMRYKNSLYELIRNIKESISTDWRYVQYKGKPISYWERECKRMNKVINDFLYDKNVTSVGYRAYIPVEMYRELSHVREMFMYFIPKTQVFSREDAEKWNNELGKTSYKSKATEGQKVTKVVGKFCRELGLDKVVDIQKNTWTDVSGVYHEREVDMGYNHYRALLGDALNPIFYERDIYVSVNPIDFYTMSFGYKWASCHTIDKDNYRHCGDGHVYEGQYSGGTESYMLDDSSMIVYIACSNEELQNEGEQNLPPELQSKWKRSVIHLGEDKFVMERVYPDGRSNGGEDNGIAAQIRQILQKTIADLLQADNMWTLKKGCGNAEGVIRNYPDAPHYPDYMYNDDTYTSYLRRHNGDLNTNKITVGAQIICPNCGCDHITQRYITCDDCRNDYDYCCDGCGEGFSKDSMYAVWIEDSNECFCCPQCARNTNYVETEDAGWRHIDDCTRDAYEELYYYYDSDGIWVDDWTWYRDSSNAESDGWRYSDYDYKWVREDEIAYDENRQESFSTEINDCYVVVDGKYFVDEESALEYGCVNVDGDTWYLNEEEAANNGWVLNDDDEWIETEVA